MASAFFVALRAPLFTAANAKIKASRRDALASLRKISDPAFLPAMLARELLTRPSPWKPLAAFGFRDPPGNLPQTGDQVMFQTPAKHARGSKVMFQATIVKQKYCFKHPPSPPKRNNTQHREGELQTTTGNQPVLNESRLNKQQHMKYNVSKHHWQPG